MENNTSPVSSPIDLQDLAKRLWQYKYLIIRNTLVACILAGIWIIPQPRVYQASVSMAPETEDGPSAMGSISSLASSFGVNLGSMTSSDAFYPVLYPDIVATNDFLIDLLKVRVQTADGSVDATLYEYLTKHQKICIWNMPKRWIAKAIKAIKPQKVIPGAGTGDNINPFCLSVEQTSILEKLRSSIVCATDKKTDVISISVTSQDPKVSALLADSTRVHLQQFMTKYRTQKARNDMQYYEELTKEARGNYQKAVAEYTSFADSHSDVSLQSYVTRRDELENEMQRCYSTLTALNTQYEAAKAKVQEHTPAFTILNAATMPVKPSGPKRMLFMLGMMILTGLGTCAWILRDELLKK